MGIQTVTVYAFSIDNFKRPKHEVDALMNLAQDKLAQMLDHSELIRHFGVRVCVLGEISLLPEKLRAIVGRLCGETRNNKGPRLNLCFPYTSSHEMVCAAKQVIQECGEDLEAITGENMGGLGMIFQSYLSDLVDKFEQALWTGTDFPQLLIRTVRGILWLPLRVRKSLISPPQGKPNKVVRLLDVAKWTFQIRCLLLLVA